MGALRLAEEPRGRAARRIDERPRAGAARRSSLPFVFRRYLDYGVFEALRAAAPRRSASRRSAAPPAGPSAPTTSSCRAAASARSNSSCSCCRWCAAASSPRCAPAPRCRRCNARGRRPDDARDAPHALAEAYTFLRRVEHRIQYLDDQQTHVLPDADDGDLELDRRAAMGFADCCAVCAARTRLGELANSSRTEFDTLLRDGGARVQRLRRPARAAASAARRRDRSTARPCSSSCRPQLRARVRPLARASARAGAARRRTAAPARGW